MIDDNQGTLFDTSMYEIHIPEPPKIQGTCSQCKYIIGVKFSKRKLYFCTFVKGDKRYGRYGKKIKKSHPACQHKKQSEDKIKVFDGYYGGEMEGVKR